MSLNTLTGDFYFNGNVAAKTMSLPAAAVSDTVVATPAGTDGGIRATKIQQQYSKAFSQEGTTDAAAERRIVHIVQGAVGTVVGFEVGAVTKAAGGGNAVIDLLKNGASILTATITLDSATANYALKSAAGFSSTSLVAGDVLEVQVVSATATKPKGLFARLVVREDAQ